MVTPKPTSHRGTFSYSSPPTRYEKLQSTEYCDNHIAMDVCIVVKACNFAAERHRLQRRKDALQTPYINHPIGVANILSSEVGVTDSTTIAAALLHDTVEDTSTTFQEISSLFGEEVQIVQECTDDKSLPASVRKQLQIENAAKHSHKAKLIHLADKLYNLRDLERETP
ncbi:unnamed protein product, partial [Brugia pahangi]|uniref:HD domain-containing protein n=1 Tax=Brugia pahangi TaxID=6280 RepID=A0A0N4T6P7_BRUPA